MDPMLPYLSDLQLVAYVKTACLALLSYDTLLQLNQEYLYVWKSRWTLIKCLYLWTRYTTFIDTIIVAIQYHYVHVVMCDRSQIFNTIFSGLGLAITEMILLVRTYTLYERSKRLLLFFFLMWFSLVGVAFWAAKRWTDRFQVHSESSASPSLPLCVVSKTYEIGIGLLCYIALLVCETVIVGLTLWKVFRRYSHPNFKVLSSFNRDGVWFYLAILPTTITTVVIIFVAPVC
ncbi:hypothetical protein C8J57DRAFT_151754 [Mycena rebaudengoi]|nr:hypothetical protein C8J57DRAFT_151754 [Mycena rebaudengoi]